MSESFRQRITQFELNRVAQVEAFMRHKKAGELVLVQQQGSSKKKRARVLKWSKTEVAILYEGDWTKATEQQTREKVASARVFRTPPALSDDYLDKVAVDLLRRAFPTLHGHISETTDAILTHAGFRSGACANPQGARNA